MNIFYFLFEGKPKLDNEERNELAGAYINCWVKAKDETTAKNKAIHYINDQGWDVDTFEETFIVSRERYIDLPDSLECFDLAENCGVGAIFNTWPIGSEDE